MLRKAAFSGRFYPGSPDQLRSAIERFSKPREDKVKVKGIVVPHAGYIYSGSVAGAVYSSVELPGRFIIISPNHWEGRTKAALDTYDSWQTPLGEVSVDTELRDIILGGGGPLKKSESAHAREHAIEVQLPFLQYYLGDDFRFVGMTLMSQAKESLDCISEDVISALRKAGEETLPVASTDMSHYISHDEAKEMDRMAIDKMLELDSEGLYNVVTANEISMCGMPAAYVVMKTALAMGAKKAELIKYTTSGEVSGDYDQVVGYAGVIFY